MRDGRRSRKSGVQAEKQQRFMRLIAQGVNNSEACRIVGIHRKTGVRWRYGRTVVNSVGERGGGGGGGGMFRGGGSTLPRRENRAIPAAEPAVLVRARADPDR